MSKSIIVKFKGFDSLGCYTATGIVLTTEEIWKKHLNSIKEDIKNGEMCYPIEDFDEIVFYYKKIKTFLECIEIIPVSDTDIQSVRGYLIENQIFGFFPFLGDELE